MKTSDNVLLTGAGFGIEVSIIAREEYILIKALFFDFYETIVHEDGVVIDEITTIISNTGDGAKKSTIDSYWWQIFRESYMNSFFSSMKDFAAI